MATPIKLPSGSYRMRVYDKQNKVYKSFTAPTKSAVKKLADQWLDNQYINVYQMTVKQAINKYIDTKRNILSPASIYKYEHIIMQFSEKFQGIGIEKLTQDNVDVEINEMAQNYKPKSVKTAHGLLSSVLKKYRPTLTLCTTLPKVQKKIKEYPTAEQIINCFKGNKDMELVVLLALCFGLRKEEIRGLKKSDFNNGKMTVQRVKIEVGSQDIERTEMKTVSSRRKLRVPDYINELVNKVDGEYITELSAMSIYKRFKTQMKHIGYPDITFHDLRHINASVMHALNVPDKYAMERGGWATNSTLKQVYQSTFSEERQNFDEVIDTYFQQKYDTKYDTKNSKRRKQYVISRK